MNFQELEETLHLQGVVKNGKQNCSVLYFLLQDGVIVYVGISSLYNLGKRIKAHRKNKAFSEWKYVPTYLDRETTLKVESGLISLIKPEYNKASIETSIYGISFLFQAINEGISEGQYDDDFLYYSIEFPYTKKFMYSALRFVVNFILWVTPACVVVFLWNCVPESDYLLSPLLIFLSIFVLFYVAGFWFSVDKDHPFSMMLKNTVLSDWYIKEVAPRM